MSPHVHLASDVAHTTAFGLTSALRRYASSDCCLDSGHHCCVGLGIPPELSETTLSVYADSTAMYIAPQCVCWLPCQEDTDSCSCYGLSVAYRKACLCCSGNKGLQRQLLPRSSLLPDRKVDSTAASPQRRCVASRAPGHSCWQLH